MTSSERRDSVRLMREAVILSVLLVSCAPTPTQRGDWMQQDIAANPGKYVPADAYTSYAREKAQETRARYLTAIGADPTLYAAPAPPTVPTIAAPSPTATLPAVPASPPRNLNQPAYCAAGSFEADQAGSMTGGLEALRERCRPGDSIILKSYNTGLIASACDMAKPVSAAGPNVFCTLGTIRQVRP